MNSNTDVNLQKRHMMFAGACLSPLLGLLIAMLTPAGVATLPSFADFGAAFLFLEGYWLICSLPFYLATFLIKKPPFAVACVIFITSLGTLSGCLYPGGWGMGAMLVILLFAGLFTLAVTILASIAKKLTHQ